MLSIYSVPNTILRTLHCILFLILIKTLWSRFTIAPLLQIWKQVQKDLHNFPNGTSPACGRNRFKVLDFSMFRKNILCIRGSFPFSLRTGCQGLQALFPSCSLCMGSHTLSWSLGSTCQLSSSVWTIRFGYFKNGFSLLVWWRIQ